MRAACCLLLAVVACHRTGGSVPDTGEPDLTGAVYDPAHVLRVDIEMDAADFAALRDQTRDGYDLLSGDCLAEPFGSPFTWFPATVTLDGTTFAQVGVRKKGFLGSMSWVKPALKIDLTEYGEAHSFSGVERLTLNNAVQDPAVLRQCLAYGFFADAGLPASRCNLARVSVNGEDLGVYVNVEPIKKPFLRRHFSSDEGNLYEGTLSDFREGWTGTLEKETNEAEDDWSDVAALVTALESEDDGLLPALEAVVDLDAFLAHWAAEVITVHVDGYAWNTNNFYLYADPADGRFRFIPWGVDGTWQAFGEDSGVPQSVYAFGYLPYRLATHPEGRERYTATLRRLLDEVYDEDVLLARLDGLQAVLLPELAAGEAETTAVALGELRDVVTARRGQILGELEGGLPEWGYGLRDDYCFDFIGDLHATFATAWGTTATHDPFTAGDAALEYTWDAASWSGEAGAVAGWSEGQPVLFIAAWISPTEAVVAYLVAAEGDFAPGTVAVDLEQRIAALYYIDTATMEDFAFAAYIMGEAVFTEAGTEDGDPVVGTLSGELMTWG